MAINGLITRQPQGRAPVWKGLPGHPAASHFTPPGLGPQGEASWGSATSGTWGGGPKSSYRRALLADCTCGRFGSPRGAGSPRTFVPTPRPAPRPRPPGPVFRAPRPPPRAPAHAPSPPPVRPRPVPPALPPPALTHPGALRVPLSYPPPSRRSRRPPWDL